MSVRQIAALVVAALTAGCGAGPHAVSKPCPVTQPNHMIPPGQEHNPGARRAPYHGNGRLWTVLWPRGVFVARPGDVARDGSISIKWGWWRGVRGDLKVTGRRLDARAAPLRAQIPGGYGRTGFQPTGIIFATAGCWRVTASAGNARLSFVTLVRKPPQAGARRTRSAVVRRLRPAAL